MMICRMMKLIIRAKHQRLRGFAGVRSENSNRKGFSAQNRVDLRLTSDPNPAGGWWRETISSSLGRVGPVAPNKPLWMLVIL